MTTIMQVPPPGGGDLTRIEVETLAEAYLWLDQVRAAHAGFLVARSERVSSLDARARYVLGSLQAARRFLCDSTAAEATAADDRNLDPSKPLPAVSPEDPLADIVERTRAELEAARDELDGWAEQQASYFSRAFEAAEAAVIDRAEVYASHYRPCVRLEVARIAGERCIVHVERPSDDDAVVLCLALAGRPPSRHDFLRDDAVEEVGGPVHLSVREHGVDPRAVTEGGPDAEEALVRDVKRRLLPIRAHLPVVMPELTWPRMRLRGRGPVLELEAREEGGEYAHIVSAEQGELFTGYLVSLRAKGILEVDIRVA